MARDEDLLFLRAAVESGVLARAVADEVLAALAKVERLGASSSAHEIALNRGLLTPEQAERVQAACGLREATPVRRARRVGNFEILEKIGVGGMGVVYKARQLSMDRLVALKVLPPRLARDRSFLERFLREARSAARLNHPHVVQGIDVGEADGLYYFAMEFVDGESLRDRLRRVGRLAQAEALQIARQVALALEHANAHHIIHRDIKPDNILLTSLGTAKLADLGLAKHTADAAVTQTAGPLGTPLYMSPEQARGEADVDTRSDIYSLGATLYRAVVGSPPFSGPNATAIITKHLLEKPPNPRDAVPELTEGFGSVLTKMLAKTPAARYQSPTELLEDLDRLLNGRAPIRAAPRATSTRLPRTRRRRRRTSAMPVLAATTLFVLAAGSWLLYSKLAGATGPPRAIAPRPEPRDAHPRHVPWGPSRPPPGEARQPGAGEAELDHLRQWAAAHPDALREMARRFRGLAARYPGTAAARAALDDAQKAEEALQATEEGPLREVCHEARRLAGQHKFAEAVALLDKFGADHPRFLDEVSEERGLILSEALKTDRELRGQAGGLARKGDFLGAIAIYRQIMGFGIPQLTGRAKHEIGLLEGQYGEAERKAREAAADAYLALRLRLAGLLEARDYAEARARLDAAREDPAMGSVREALDADAADLVAIVALWAAAEQGARSLKPEERFSAGGIRGEFVRFADGEIHVRASGLLCRKPLRGLTTHEVLALAGRVRPAGEPATHVARGLFLLAEGKTNSAAQAFKEGEKAGGDVRRYLALLERRRSDMAEAEAEALFARIEELAGAGDWRQARDALRAFEEKHGRTRSFARRAARVDHLALQARLAILDATDLFHGKCRLVGAGPTVEVVYEFRDVAELADWDLRGVDWGVEEGRLRLVGARAVLRAPVVRELQAGVDLADGSGPPGEWGVGLAETAETPPVYSVALPERIGLKVVLRQHRREVARGGAPFRLNERRRLDFGMRGSRIAIEADGREVLSWTDEGGQPAPPLRLGVGSERERAVLVSGVRVVAEVAEPWVSEELERLRLRVRKQHALAHKPWRSLFNGVSLDPWCPQHGNWAVRDGAISTQFGGRLVLDDGEYEDFELRLRVRPDRDNAVLRVSYRLARSGQRYALALGRRPESCFLALQKQPQVHGGELARFGQRVDWKPGRWYDLRLVAVGSEFRAELDGALLCLVRDDRRHVGALALDALHGGLSLRSIACRHLGGEDDRPDPPSSK